MFYLLRIHGSINFQNLKIDINTLRGADQKKLHSQRICPLRGGGQNPCPLRNCKFLWGKNQKCLECSEMQEYATIFFVFIGCLLKLVKNVYLFPEVLKGKTQKKGSGAPPPLPPIKKKKIAWKWSKMNKMNNNSYRNINKILI